MDFSLAMGRLSRKVCMGVLPKHHLPNLFPALFDSVLQPLGTG